MGINIFQLFSLLSIIISIDHAHGGESPESVQLPIDNIDEKYNVHLRKIDSHLANEHLPVYIIRKNNPFVLERMESIMESTGKFSMYQDPETSSAAVFFEKKNKFNGIIGVDYVMHELPYLADEDKVYISERTLLPQPKTAFVTSESDALWSNQLDNENLPVETSPGGHDVVYIEILVMIDDSMLQKHIVDDIYRHDYRPVVPHILSLFNSVDMLYAKVKNPKIKINIAGIIMSEEPETFGFLKQKECVEEKGVRSDGQIKVIRSLKGECIAEAFATYISKLKNNHAFPHPFDAVVFLTGLNIHKFGPDGTNIIAVRGFQGDLDWQNMEGPRFPTDFSFSAIVGDRHFGEFITIAHELGHGFSVVEHDPEPYFDINGVCCGYLMRQGDHACKKCLRWSPRSEELFRSFFNSPAGCIYTDEPKSLRSGPFKVMSATEQCQCYGYKSARKSYANVFGISRTNICEKPLKCFDHSGSLVEPTPPMDGTPCGMNKVCWVRQCRRIAN